MRDQLAARLNCGKSGRSLDRLERLLDLPLDIQHAISRGTLTKSHGEKILRLAPDVQAAIARALREGIPARQVLRDYRPSDDTWPSEWIPKKLEAAKAKLARTLELEVGNL